MESDPPWGPLWEVPLLITRLLPGVLSFGSTCVCTALVTLCKTRQLTDSLVAFGAVGLLLIWFTLKKPPPAAKGALPWLQKIRELDIPGAIVLLGSTTCLNLTLQWGGIVYPWSHPNVFGCLIGFAVLLAIFIFLQARGKERYIFHIP